MNLVKLIVNINNASAIILPYKTKKIPEWLRSNETSLNPSASYSMTELCTDNLKSAFSHYDVL